MIIITRKRIAKWFTKYASSIHTNIPALISPYYHTLQRCKSVRTKAQYAVIDGYFFVHDTMPFADSKQQWPCTLMGAMQSSADWDSHPRRGSLQPSDGALSFLLASAQHIHQRVDLACWRVVRSSDLSPVARNNGRWREVKIGWSRQLDSSEKEKKK